MSGFFFEDISWPPSLRDLSAAIFFSLLGIPHLQNKNLSRIPELIQCIRQHRSPTNRQRPESTPIVVLKYVLPAIRDSSVHET
jgi:hypothetical protein